MMTMEQAERNIAAILSEFETAEGCTVKAVRIDDIDVSTIYCFNILRKINIIVEYPYGKDWVK